MTEDGLRGTRCELRGVELLPEPRITGPSCPYLFTPYPLPLTLHPLPFLTHTRHATRYRPDEDHLSENQIGNLFAFITTHYKETGMQKLQHWIDGHIPALIRITIGICYLWFGMLKFFPNLSPAEDLAGQTITLLTFGLIQPPLSLTLLAIWEVLVGILFLSNRGMRIALPAMVVHMICTLTPAFLLPEAFFTHFPYGLTLAGQYIIKNLVFLAAALVLSRQVTGMEGARQTQS